METPNLSHLSSKDYAQVYEPAEDSYLLIDALEKDLELIKCLKPLVCAEVGSGSGIVISALGKALGSSSRYIATDINPVACHITRQTGYKNGVDIDVINTDLICGLLSISRVDILVFNPPYVVTESEEIHNRGVDGDLALAWAGGQKGREVMDRLFPVVSDFLSWHGLFYLLLIKDNCPMEVKAQMEQFGFIMNIVKERKIRGEHQFVLRFQRKTYQESCAKDVELKED